METDRSSSYVGLLKSKGDERDRSLQSRGRRRRDGQGFCRDAHWLTKCINIKKKLSYYFYIFFSAVGLL